ncbi:extracellular solute-binding protein [Paenibacillus sp. LHD-117]|uniref:extracellular solute-binding protein n=1 Tax=Paenibacillus sp. LHD-117 TaxID=3071412 RepID=UPI0027DEBC22|nr:extracellular solute-binding protein [Paenibacillus sp. LHD-117]MDQ6423285.1 extracellular solute-binding protein [Paenibacillus sp. LHD-117]
MPKLKSIILMMLAMLVVLSANIKPEEHSSIYSSGSSSSSFDEHLTISIAFWNIDAAFERADPVLRKIESKFNITIQPVQITMADYKQKLQMWATSGKLPDVFSHSIASDSPGVYNEWIKHGLIKPLPEDLSLYPNVNSIAQIPDIRLLKENNRLYMLPRIGYPTNRLWMLERVVYVRKDWMKDALIRDVATFEDFSNMLVTFTNRRSGAGSDQRIVGLTAAGMNYLSWALSSTFPQFAAGQWVFENNQWIPYYASAQMEEVVVQLRELYTNGALDQDFYYLKEQDAVTKFAEGQAGALVYRATPESLRLLEDEWNSHQPGRSFRESVEILHLWPDEEGKRYYYVAQTYWSETFFNSKLSDKKMDRILRLYDYLLSPDGELLTSYGIEGVDYRMDGEDIVLTRPLDKATGRPEAITKVYPSLSIFRSLASWGKEADFRLNDANIINYGETNIRKSLSEMEWQIKNGVATPAYHKINSLSTPAKDRLSAEVDPLEDLIKVIISDENPVNMWREYMETYEELGLRDAIREVNAALSRRDE